MNTTLLKVLAVTVICLLGFLCLKGGTGRFLILFVLFVLALIYILAIKYFDKVLVF
jgi:hypothetical protein